MSRLDELIDELERRLAALTPEEQRDLAELIGRAARTAGVSLDEAARTLTDLARGLARHVGARAVHRCSPPETRRPWYLRSAARWPCLALPPHFGEGFCAAPLECGRCGAPISGAAPTCPGCDGY